jgi:hypothetical protein
MNQERTMPEQVRITGRARSRQLLGRTSRCVCERDWDELCRTCFSGEVNRNAVPGRPSPTAIALTRACIMMLGHGTRADVSGIDSRRPGDPVSIR